MQTTAQSESPRAPFTTAPFTTALSETGRALVPVERHRMVEPDSSGRPLATFLAQLVAAARRFPQTRVHRRTEPQIGAGRYRRAIPPDAPGRLLSRLA